MAGTYHITTFGCQMNSYDSEMMEGILVARGMTRAASEETADIVLYNTCVVREHAEERALARLMQLKNLKQRRPGMIVGVTGCMAQKEADKLLDRLPHLDLILGTRAIARLSPLLDRLAATGQPQTCVEVLDAAYPADVVPVRQKPLKAPVNIIFGCNKSCSYCIVPRTRGAEESRPAAQILGEVATLCDHGYREITLVGQNVNSYRGLAADGSPLAFGLLMREADRVIAASGREVWLRYITSHPRDCNTAHISAVAECASVCENFHLPVQAGSNEVLKRMRRVYTRERYLTLIDQVRAAVPTATLTTDIIVGFPGETEADFEQTLELVRQVRYDSAFMYMYSPRSGTLAAEEFKDHIPVADKKARLAALIALQEQISAEKMNERIGRTERVLVEDLAPRTPGDVLARTRGDLMVIIPGGAELIGQFVDAEIVGANSHTLFGRALTPALA